MQMNRHKKTTRLPCQLNVRGSLRANAEAEQDLMVPDPDSRSAQAAIEQAMEREPDGQQEAAGAGHPDNPPDRQA